MSSGLFIFSYYIRGEDHEMSWTVGSKASQGFTKLVLRRFTIRGAEQSFFPSLALREFPLIRDSFHNLDTERASCSYCPGIKLCDESEGMTNV